LPVVVAHRLLEVDNLMIGCHVVGVNGLFVKCALGFG
jgi:hypothetical protein